ncbi:hypothetical protein [Flavobacterium enshiense]|nr:hypothetical protein [Flavobacterium enshiense]
MRRRLLQYNRKAEKSGTIVDDRFKATSFKLIEEKN